jgi:methyl-accepting chemotaxis protein
MTFSRRIALCFALPIVLLSTALGVALYGLADGQRDLQSYFARQHVFSESVADLYAQGLQMGQALRNIVLDPANGQAYKNYDGAKAAFDEAFARANTAADNEESVALSKISELRQRQAGAQQRVLATLKDDPTQARAILNREETPAWRELRAGLLEQGKAARERTEVLRQHTMSAVQHTTRTAVALAIAALAAALCMVVLLRSTLRREIGGEPAAAREALHAVAQGDLARNVPCRPGDDSSLMAAIVATQAALRRVVNDVRQGVDAVAAASRQIALGNADLSSRTEQQASNLQETAASMEQLTSSVRHNADSSRLANTQAASATRAAEDGGDMVAGLVATMQSITQSSRKIAEIIGVIDGIAFQTNILALNAAVESARAGEHGRGFAVVAAEVRALAQRSGQAAREISQLIAESVNQVDHSAQLVNDASERIRGVVGQVREVSGLVDSITQATVEQSSGITQVSSAVAQLDNTTQQNAALVEQSAAAAQSLQEQAEQLARAVGVFRLAA